MKENTHYYIKICIFNSYYSIKKTNFAFQNGFITEYE